MSAADDEFLGVGLFTEIRTLQRGTVAEPQPITKFAAKNVEDHARSNDGTTHDAVDRDYMIFSDSSGFMTAPHSHVEAYRRYWAIQSFDDDGQTIRWVESRQKDFMTPLNVSRKELNAICRERPVTFKGLRCPRCNEPVRIHSRREAVDAICSPSGYCGSCWRSYWDELVQRNDRERDERMLESQKQERKLRRVFESTSCEDSHLSECLKLLSTSALELYLDLKQKSDNPEQGFYREELPGHSVYLINPWLERPQDLAYQDRGPDLFSLSRHRLIEPERLNGFVTLTQHGLIDPKGLPHVAWVVHSAPDGFPVEEEVQRLLREVQGN
ncbi:hypothetical protein ACLQ8T_16445 (plasmid) [Glutamicibacter sp. FR1]|uniref:hypothetical protein n=1 Tax=Glutamicibacter sp. FR1 TaxID=3393744 RepID=UPI0039AE96A0